MKRHFRFLIRCSALLWLLLAGLPFNAIGASPTNFSEAQARIFKHGTEEISWRYQEQFITSVGKKLCAAIEAGFAAKGKSSFDVIFLVAADGRIVNAFLSKPDEQPLGKYVAAKMISLRVPKPPEGDWPIYFSMQPHHKHQSAPDLTNR